MEQLSSCYFCGTALDASVETYPVVPRALEPTSDEQRAISLCPSCRQKLAHVVESVVSATANGDGSTVSDSDIETPTPDAELVPDDGGDETGSGEETAQTDDIEESEQPAAEPVDNTQSTQDSTRTQSTQDNSASPSDADDGPSLTALEYNKVMRLLQNREFPVEKSEIKTVAINAYEVSETEFDAIIDAAIDRGLIDEENGQFVAGD